MMTFNILMENDKLMIQNMARMNYFPLHGVPHVLGTLGSAIGGGYLGYKFAEESGLKNPESGMAPGAISGFYLGNLAAEYADRKARELEKKPCRGERTFGDSANETAIGIGIGVPTSIAVGAATGIPSVSLMSGGISGRLGTYAYNRLKYPEAFEIKKK